MFANTNVGCRQLFKMHVRVDLNVCKRIYTGQSTHARLVYRCVCVCGQTAMHAFLLEMKYKHTHTHTYSTYARMHIHVQVFTRCVTAGALRAHVSGGTQPCVGRNQRLHETLLSLAYVCSTQKSKAPRNALKPSVCLLNAEIKGSTKRS